MSQQKHKVNKETDKKDQALMNQVKGLFLANLLNKNIGAKKKLNQPSEQKDKQQAVNIGTSEKIIKPIILPQVDSLQHGKTIFTKKQDNSSLLKSKLTSYEEHSFSYDDSRSIQQSSVLGEKQSVNQMLKYIYIQLLGEDKYITDFKRYLQIEQNLDQYNVEQSHQFNKEGKLLENIIYQINTMKVNIKKFDSQVKKLNKQLDEAYAKMHKQQKMIFELENALSLQKTSQRLNKIQQKPIISYQEILNENQILNMNVKQLQEEIFVLQQSLQRAQNDHQKYVQKIQKQNLNNQTTFQRLEQLEQIITLRDNQIDNLLFGIGQLEIELNDIKNEIKIKQIQNLKRTLTKERNGLNNQFSSSKSDINRLSTIKQEEDIINTTDFVKQEIQNVDKQVQTNELNEIKQFSSLKKLSSQNQNPQIKAIEESQTDLQRIINELKKLIVHKQNIIIGYQKQIQNHQTQVEKYQAFISQLSAQIQICQTKLAENNKKSGQFVNRKIQTDDKYFTFLHQTQSLTLKEPQPLQNQQTSLNEQSPLNQQLTHGQREDSFLLSQKDQKQPSIADEVDKLQAKIQTSGSQVINKGEDNLFTFKKVTSSFFQKSSNRQISEIAGNQKYWDEISVNLSQFSETEQLRDIRNLTKQLSQAYDKIIALTYEVNSLKRLTLNQQSQNQSNLRNGSIKMFKQK